ncbi:MAG TPA: TIGR03936 family radical SAM-associated protein, partial [Desulfatiglandales bacterium]|nr:TIGR03936 family radical SAM-associated protein [Desulfatiglandales bacterium]
QPEMSWLEGIFSRGDRRLTPILVEAWRSGARFDAWDEHFSMDIWKEAFKRQGVDPGLYLYRSRSMDELLPWDHIRSGVRKDYLKREWDNAQDGKTTPDCREKCHECGVCDHKYVDHVIYRDYSPSTVIEEGSFNHLEGEIKKYRLTFSKMDPAAYLSHLELVQTFIRALRRTGLKMVFSRGYHPMPRVSFASALPVGTESLHETVDIELYEAIHVSTFGEAINRQLPEGLRVKLIEDISPAVKSAALIESRFLITVNNQKIDETRIKDFLDSDSFPILKKNKKEEREVDARSIVKEITCISPDTISLVIKHVNGPEIRPAQIIQEIFRLKDRDMEEIKILKTGQIMG